MIVSCTIYKTENYIPNEWTLFSNTENIISNTCIFNILRFKKENIICNDYGKNKKYCNHFTLPNEFIIYNEYGIDNQNNIIIKPDAMWEIYENKKKKIAQFKYVFICKKEDNNNLSLILNIFPESEFDKSLIQEIFEILITITILIIILFPIILYCNNYKNYLTSSIIIGYILTSNNKSNKKRILSE